MSKLRFFIPIAKIDRERRTVAGWATTEKLDKQNEVVDYEASKKAFGDWQGNIRVMHQPKAVGRAIDIQHDDDGKRIYVTAKISKGAQDTWEMVKDGTLTGFSIGGQTIDKVTQLVKDDEETKQVTRITKYKLNELSLVDNPANPDAQFELVKSVGGQLRQTSVVENVTNKITKYHGGEYETMALSKKTLTKISNLVKTLDRIVKEDWEDPNAVVNSSKETPHQTTEGSDSDADEHMRVGKADGDGDWEDPNPEVTGSKTTPEQTTEGTDSDEAENMRVGKSDMDTDPDSSLQTQDPDGSDAAPVRKRRRRYYKAEDMKDDEDYPKKRYRKAEDIDEDDEDMDKSDMDTDPDSSLQTQDPDGSDAAPVKKRRYRKQYDEDEKETEKRYSRKQEDAEEDEDVEKQHQDEYTGDTSDEVPTTTAKKRYRKAADMEDEDEDVEKAEDDDEEMDYPKKRYTRKRHYRKQNDEDEDEDMDKADDEYEEDDEKKVSKTVLSELRKIHTRLDKIETTPLPRKYHRVEKGAGGSSDDDVIQKTTDEVRKAQEESRITGKPLSQEIERKKDWLINQSLDKKFGTADLRKV